MRFIFGSLHETVHDHKSNLRYMYFYDLNTNEVSKSGYFWIGIFNIIKEDKPIVSPHTIKNLTHLLPYLAAV